MTEKPYGNVRRKQFAQKTNAKETTHTNCTGRIAYLDGECGDSESQKNETEMLGTGHEQADNHRGACPFRVRVLKLAENDKKAKIVI